MSNILRPGTSYITYFPNSTLTTVYTLLENHSTTERHHIQYTFLDHSLNKVKITKGAAETIRFTEWQANRPCVENYAPLKFDNNRYANSKEWSSDDDLYA
jgi:hypothetical protein